MDAVIRSEVSTTGVYLYFYFFRLLSFLVRSSVALKNKMQNERQVPCCLSLHRAG
jgi:hypothetical protein